MTMKEPGDKVEIRPAATVIVLRDSDEGLQTLLLRRNSKLAFAGGAWVFPGGRFDEPDYQAANSRNDSDAATHAAAREAREECGLILDPEEFVYYAHWTTPARMPKRFATWFFMCQYADAERVVIDGSEIHDHLWVAPQMALERHADRDIELMPPTFVSLTELSEFKEAKPALAAFAARTPRIYEPRFAENDGVLAALYSGDAGYETSDPSLPGPRHRCLMPGQGAWQYQFSG